MSKSKQNILLLGSNVLINNLPIKEVSLLHEGSLPAYGYNPGDSLELLAGGVTVEQGRQEQCLTWLNSLRDPEGPEIEIRSRSYGDPKEVYQFFRQRKTGTKAPDTGWFMFHQILPPEGRSDKELPLDLAGGDREIFTGNNGIMVIDDGGKPPSVADELQKQNPSAWVIGMGISVAHWHEWAKAFGSSFCLFCRLSDLETTRMEMDSGLIWETLTATTLRALRSDEVDLWDPGTKNFRCHIIIEMFPHGILYAGPDGILLRHRKASLPEKSSPRHRGSVPCYDTLVTSMLAQDCIRTGRLMACRNYFAGFSELVLNNWQFLNDHGYAFNGRLKLPELDFSPVCNIDPAPTLREPCLIRIDPDTAGFDLTLEAVSGQSWTEGKKEAIRGFFPYQPAPGFSKGLQDGLSANYLDVITEILHYLKDEVSWKKGFNDLRLFNVGNLRTIDPVEIDAVTTLQNVMDSYVCRDHFLRPLCVGVFGPPGSGKSFAVKEVARVISRKFDTNPFEFFEFNLTQFDGPDEINSAIEPIRASVAKGMVPIVFWDEFDCRYDGHEFGYLRYFLPSMQDGVTYVHGIPYNIGRAIFVFAGGVKNSWEKMEQLLDPDNLDRAKAHKIPDFLSRLRVVLDIDGINIPEEYLADKISDRQLADLRRVLVKRAFIIAHQMDTHWKQAARKTSGLLLRLLLARYKFGARSIEAVIESSGAADRLVYGLPELIAPSASRIHAEWRIDIERQVDQLRKQKGLRSVW
ncbi:MAG: AAA family ATPase [Proteobacteria bacterium]|nr:AAA family ATPase [Pseudomonadota bacterium]MBU1737887.1 AAA family ATPase [Pseudomonadota bacterium]